MNNKATEAMYCLKKVCLTIIVIANIISADVIVTLVYIFVEAEQHDWIYKCKGSGGTLGYYNKASAKIMRRWSD